MRGKIKRWWKRRDWWLFGRYKISTPYIHAEGKALGTTDPVLMIYREYPVDYFPNRTHVSHREIDEPDILVDPDYAELSKIPDESYEHIICAGLLEHVANQQRAVDNMYRILRPGGRCVARVSCCFSVHEGPRDFYHMTIYGARHLFRNGWERVEAKGCTGPFLTLGILLQRILLQCRIWWPVRLLVEPLVHLLPWFDRFVYEQYDHVSLAEDRRIDSMLPSNVLVVAYKPEGKAKPSADVGSSA